MEEQNGMQEFDPTVDQFHWLALAVTNMADGTTRYLEPDDCEEDSLVVNDNGLQIKIVKLTQTGAVVEAGDSAPRELDYMYPVVVGDYRLEIIPLIAYNWEILWMRHGGVSIPFQREFLKPGTILADEHLRGHSVVWLRGWRVADVDDRYVTLLSPSDEKVIVSVLGEEVDCGDESFVLEGFSYIVYEWDEVEECPVKLIFDSQDFDRIADDAEAAYRIAESVEEQVPELLDIVARYMDQAYELGSKDAEAWLRDYHEVDDSRYHPYV